ncbi:alpha/beta fold hydrolase [Saccharopolyspora sp. CA-218241]|uniref:alpha/beta fold hydrolase n=1 Tax=Saccharopolyspora sp. CA-218241 TaxID=3240027 RepID=UPI003D964441
MPPTSEPQPTEPQHWVDTADGLRLPVWERGDPAAPTVLLVHGYPDDHAVWDGVADVLAERFHVVAHDVRGAGRAGVPARRSGFRLDRLAEDLRRVADAVAPGSPVHLVAHDWGAIQTWHAVTDPRADDRFASFTSISGPCLDHAGRWIRDKLRRPTPAGLRALLTQLVRSGYIGFFQLPALPELAWRSGALPRLLRALERPDRRAAARPTRPALADGVRGLALYRENIRPRSGARRPRRTGLPVQVLAPAGDPFVSAPVQTEIEPWVPDLRISRVPGGHWLPRSRPALVAEHAADLIDHVENHRPAK